MNEKTYEVILMCLLIVFNTFSITFNVFIKCLFCKFEQAYCDNIYISEASLVNFKMSFAKLLPTLLSKNSNTIASVVYDFSPASLAFIPAPNNVCTTCCVPFYSGIPNRNSI